ncbi:hypothetical protein ACQ5SO_03080 [Rhodovulum sp. DZ06]|uniref:hypothetical protein n=1 Tax=Rhodovulum sp. DZ06 TaxID=3425126 RepID=UPI003D32BF77
MSAPAPAPAPASAATPAPARREIGPPPPATGRARQALWALAALPLLLWLVAVPGLFNVDEALYFLSADAMARHGSFTVQNGWEQYPVAAMKLWFLVEGTGGLTSQYPPGPALLGAGPVSALGIRGLTLLNALAAAGTVFAVRALAWRMFGDARVALGAAAIFMLSSFWLEFSVGVWPHAITVCLTTVALALGLGAADAQARGAALGRAAAAGAALGAACLFRLDAILVLPAIGAFAVLFAARPWAMIAGGAAGLAGPLLALAALNQAKFGALNPFSYGRDDGLTTLSGHAPLLGAAAAGLGLLVLFRALPRRQGAALAGGLALAAAIGAALVPAVGAALGRVGFGAWGLLVDARALIDLHPHLIPGPGGTMLNLGLAKKALGQSLPWAGLLLAAPFLRWDGRGRRGALLCAIAAAPYAAAFLPSAWFGGLGGNMRYFMPLLPLLAALGAAVLARLIAAAGGGAAVGAALRLGGLGGGAAAVGWLLAGPGGAPGAQQVLALWLLAAVAAASLAAGLAAAAPGAPGGLRRGTARAAVALGAAGFAGGLFAGGMDLAFSQHRRAVSALTAEALAGIEAPSMMFGPPELLANQVGRDDALIAMVSNRGYHVDAELLRRALADGRAVAVHTPLMPEALALIPGLEAREVIETPSGDWVLVGLPGGDPAR